MFFCILRPTSISCNVNFCKKFKQGFSLPPNGTDSSSLLDFTPTYIFIERKPLNQSVNHLARSNKKSFKMYPIERKRYYVHAIDNNFRFDILLLVSEWRRSKAAATKVKQKIFLFLLGTFLLRPSLRWHWRNIAHALLLVPRRLRRSSRRKTSLDGANAKRRTQFF